MELFLDQGRGRRADIAIHVIEEVDAHHYGEDIPGIASPHGGILWSVRRPRACTSSVYHYLHASERFGGLQWVGWALASSSGCKPPAKAVQVQILPGPPSPTCPLVPGTRARGRARLGRVHRGWGLVFRERSRKLAISLAVGLAVVTLPSGLLPIAALASAPGATAADGPGALSHFDVARKDCLGTARNTTSKVWYTVANGVLSDVYFPTADNTNVETLQFVVTDGQTFN